MLNVAAFFVPGLNEIMLAVVGAQLMDTFFHGVEAWEDGENAEAVAQLASLAMNLAQFGALGAAGAALRSSAFVDGMVRVTLPNGEPRLWKPDLTGYSSSHALPADLAPNALGQYQVGDRHFIRLDGKVYEQRFDAELKQWRIKHPNDSNAYEPTLRHNDNGAWTYHGEQPLRWNRQQLLRRIGHATDGLDDRVLEQTADISGVGDDALRRMHVNHEPVPPLLADTLYRLQIEGRITRMVEHMRSGQRLEPGMTYPAALAVQLPRWPAGRVLEVFAGTEPWGPSIKYGSERWPNGRSIKVVKRDLANGQLAQAILAELDEGQVSALLGDDAPRESRIQVLNGRLADLAEQRRSTIFDSLYTRSTIEKSPAVKRLQSAFTLLPDDVAQALVRDADSGELALMNLEEGGRIPLRIAEQARLYQREIRLNRALEGLCQPHVASPDRDLLALGLMKNLPGWTGEVRLTLREHNLAGEPLASVGSESAADSKTLVQQRGRYYAYDRNGLELNAGEDFFSALLKALPDSERQASKFHIGQGPALQAALADLALADRERASALLGQQPIRPWYKPVLRLGDGRTGYPLGGVVGKLDGHMDSRLQELYPDLSAVRRNLLKMRLFNTPNPEDALAALEQEWQALQSTLDTWYAESAHYTNFAGFEDRNARGAIRERIKDAWRRSGSARRWETLDLSFKSARSLPELNAQFPHIKSLNLRGTRFALPEGLLACFPNLESLNLGETRLTRIPQQVSELRQLRVLDLSGNNLTPDAELFAPLSGHSRLRVLDIKNCHVTQLPAAALQTLTTLPALDTLNLSGNELRLNLFSLGQLAELRLQRLRLQNNQISLDSLAARQFQSFAHLRELNMSNNPLGHAPDVGTLGLLQRLQLVDCQIAHWPEGLTTLMNQNQFNLRLVDLSENEITEVPDLLATRYGRAVQQVQGDGMPLNLDFNPLDATSIDRVRAIGVNFVGGEPLEDVALWTDGASALEKEQWEAVINVAGARPLVDVLDRLLLSRDFELDAANLRGRVRNVIAAASENGQMLEDLCEIAEQFPVTCGDAGAEGFSALEVEVLAYRASLEAADAEQRVSGLRALYARLFRRSEVNRIADRVSLRRTQRQQALIANADTLPALDAVDDIGDAELRSTGVDDVEIRLRLRLSLSSMLDFPEPAQSMLYDPLAQVSTSMIARVADEVRATDKVQSRQKWMAGQPGWRHYVRKANQEVFAQLDDTWLAGNTYLDACIAVPPSTGELPSLSDTVLQVLKKELKQSLLDDHGVLQRISLTDEEYLLAIGVLRDGLDNAKEALILQLTQS